MTITVVGPNGAEYEFPDTMSQEEIANVMRQQFPPEESGGISGALETAGEYAGAAASAVGNFFWPEVDEEFADVPTFGLMDATRLAGASGGRQLAAGQTLAQDDEAYGDVLENLAANSGGVPQMTQDRLGNELISYEDPETGERVQRYVNSPAWDASDVDRFVSGSAPYALVGGAIGRAAAPLGQGVLGTVVNVLAQGGGAGATALTLGEASKLAGSQKGVSDLQAGLTAAAAGLPMGLGPLASRLISGRRQRAVATEATPDAAPGTPEAGPQVTDAGRALLKEFGIEEHQYDPRHAATALSRMVTDSDGRVTSQGRQILETLEIDPATVGVRDVTRQVESRLFEDQGQLTERGLEALSRFGLAPSMTMTEAAEVARRAAAQGNRTEIQTQRDLDEFGITLDRARRSKDPDLFQMADDTLHGRGDGDVGPAGRALLREQRERTLNETRRAALQIAGPESPALPSEANRVTPADAGASVVRTMQRAEGARQAVENEAWRRVGDILPTNRGMQRLRERLTGVADEYDLNETEGYLGREHSEHAMRLLHNFITRETPEQRGAFQTQRPTQEFVRMRQQLERKRTAAINADPNGEDAMLMREIYRTFNQWGDDLMQATQATPEQIRQADQAVEAVTRTLAQNYSREAVDIGFEMATYGDLADDVLRQHINEAQAEVAAGLGRQADVDVLQELLDNPGLRDSLSEIAAPEFGFPPGVTRDGSSPLIAGGPEAVVAMRTASDHTHVFRQIFRPTGPDGRLREEGRLIKDLLDDQQMELTPARVVSKVFGTSPRVEANPAGVRFIRTLRDQIEETGRRLAADTNAARAARERGVSPVTPEEVADTLSGLRAAYWQRLVFAEGGEEMLSPTRMARNIEAALEKQYPYFRELYSQQEISTMRRFVRALRHVDWQPEKSAINPSGSGHVMVRAMRQMLRGGLMMRADQERFKAISGAGSMPRLWATIYGSLARSLPEGTLLKDLPSRRAAAQFIGPADPGRAPRSRLLSSASPAVGAMVARDEAARRERAEREARGW